MTTSLIPRDWRRRRDAPPRSARFDIEKIEDGYRLNDWAYAKCLTFDLRREAEGAARFCRAYVKRWGDIDLGSFPWEPEQTLHYDDEDETREWWEKEYPKCDSSS